MQRASPPTNLQQLLNRCEQISGLSIGDIANLVKTPVPNDLKTNKGWIGQLLEAFLGADSESKAQPDFSSLSIELKTIPLSSSLDPVESTYVCTAPLKPIASWESSWVKQKLAKVLWVPIQGNNSIPVSKRCIGTPFLWQPTTIQTNQLKQDWHDIMEYLCHGRVGQLTAKIGKFLQIRPKAASSKILVDTIDSDGNKISTVPKGFYLRPSFTRTILAEQFE